MAEFDHWMKFHVGDYLADTMHLSTFQHGIYVLLIMHYFKRGELPLDEQALMRIAKVPSALLWRSNAGPVMALFPGIGKNGGPGHPRIDSTRAEAKRLSEKRANAGRSGASKRWGIASAIDENGKCHDGLAGARATTATARVEKEKNNPPVAPPREGGRRTRGFSKQPKQSRAAFVDMAAEMIADRQDTDDRVVPLRRGIT